MELSSGAPLEQMTNEVWDILSKESVILCGDGRNDSPGHSPKYCMYALMEQHLDVIVDVEVVDKRQTKGISTNMEVFGLKTILERMVGKLLISEVVTDASAAVMKLVGEMKGNKYNMYFWQGWFKLFFNELCSFVYLAHSTKRVFSCL